MVTVGALMWEAKCPALRGHEDEQTLSGWVYRLDGSVS